MDHPVLLVSPEGQGEGGIGDFASKLSSALVGLGLPSRTSVGLPANRGDSPPSICVVNYQPYMYGWQGLSPELVYWALRGRGSREAMRALIVHEPFSFGTTTATRVRERLQRRQLACVANSVDVRIVTCERWAKDLEALLEDPVHVLPVGSNIDVSSTPPEIARARWRGELGIGMTDLVTLEFGRSHVSKAHGATTRALTALAAADTSSLHHIVIGASQDQRVRAPASVVVHTLGWLREAQVSELFFAADLLLAPFTDGVSARRTSVISAYSHDLAVATNAEAPTDQWLRDLSCTGLQTLPAYAAALADPLRRRRLAQKQRVVFENDLAWPQLARRFHAMIGGE